MPATLVLVRHGETEWSLSGRHTGNTDLPLTENGRELARRLAPALAGRELALVLSSPLRRASETAALAGLGDRAERTDDLREWDYGDYEGRTTPEIRAARPGWDLWRDGAPGGEAPAQVAARADRVIARVRATDGPCVAVAHGHILRVLAARWLGMGAEAGRHLVLGTATLSLLGWERRTPAVLVWNAAALP